MANSHSNLTSLFTDIASAIREKNGNTNTIVADAFPTAIRDIEVGESADKIFEKVLSRGFSEINNYEEVATIGNYAFYSCMRLTTVSSPFCTSIGSAAFMYCTALTTANFPKCTTIGNGAFSRCYTLTTVSFPVCTTIGNYAFYNCTSLATASFPVCTTISSNAFANCNALATANFPECTSIGSYAFEFCFNLKSLYLTGSSICTLSASNAFTSTPIGGYSTSAGTYGSIYVPASLLTSYKTATNWTYFSSRFVGI